MTDDSVIFIGLDTSKLKISVAIADGSRNLRSAVFGRHLLGADLRGLNGQQAFQARLQASLLL